MFRLSLRHSVPATTDGGALQEVLQYLRFSCCVYSGFTSAALRRRKTFGTICLDTLPRVGPQGGSPALPVQDPGDGAVAVHASFHFVVVSVSIFIYSYFMST